jgi:hypothetical protein
MEVKIPEGSFTQKIRQALTPIFSDGRTPCTVFVEDIPNLENEEAQAV